MKKSKKNKKVVEKICLLTIIIVVVLIVIYSILVKSIKIKVNDKEINLNDTYKEEVKGYFLGKDISENIKKTGSVNTSKSGTYKIKYELKYLLFKKSKTIEVVVKDTIKPVLTLNDKEIEIYVVNTEYKEQGYTALDNVDGDITKKVKADKSNLDIKKPGTYRIKYTVKDSSGNTASAERQVVYENPNTKGISVVNYHFFYNPKTEACNEDICERDDDFRSHLKYLKDNNYKTLTIREFRDWMYGKIEIPEKSVLITVDDGAKGTGKHNGDNLNTILKEYKMHATLFLVTGWWDIENYKSDYLDIESHTNDMHTGGLCSKFRGAKILCSSNEYVMNDLKKSIEITKSKIAFCYPFYAYNETSTKQVKQAGFELAFIGGEKKVTKDTDKWHIPRYPITKEMTLDDFIKIVN